MFDSVDSVEFAQIRFDRFSMGSLMALLKGNEGFLTVVTPNVDHIVRANRDESFRLLYSKADISVNDSRVLKSLARLIKLDLGEVIPGSNLTKEIILSLQGSDTPVTIIGSSGETVDYIKKKYSLSGISHYNPPMGFIDDPDEVERCVDFIMEHPSKYIFLAVGSPRQEILAFKARDAGACGNALCIGASMLFLSGEEKRAPLFVQKLSLEWLYRLLQSPRRLAKRYLIDGMEIFPLLIKEKRKRKR